jgi:hypothetical protein
MANLSGRRYMLRLLVAVVPSHSETPSWPPQAGGRGHPRRPLGYGTRIGRRPGLTAMANEAPSAVCTSDTARPKAKSFRPAARRSRRGMEATRRDTHHGDVAAKDDVVDPSVLCMEPEDARHHPPQAATESIPTPHRVVLTLVSVRHKDDSTRSICPSREPVCPPRASSAHRVAESPPYMATRAGVLRRQSGGLPTRTL